MARGCSPTGILRRSRSGGTTGLQSFADISHFRGVPTYPPSYRGTAEKYRQDGIEILHYVTPQELPRRRR